MKDKIFKRTGLYIICETDYSGNSALLGHQNLIHLIKKVNLNVEDSFSIYGSNKMDKKSFIDNISLTIFPPTVCDKGLIDYTQHFGRWCRLNCLRDYTDNFYIDESFVPEANYVDDFITPKSNVYKESLINVLDFLYSNTLLEVLQGLDSLDYIISVKQFEKIPDNCNINVNFNDIIVFNKYFNNYEIWELTEQDKIID